MPKILIVQLGRIGDMILATPLFHKIKEKYQDAEISVLAGRHNAVVLQNNPYIKNIIIYDKNPIKLLCMLWKLINNNYDYLIDPKDHYSTESMLIACIVQANKRIGFNKTGNSFYDSGIPGSGQNEGLHYTKRCFNALKPLGISPPDPLPLPELYPPDPSEQFAEQYILENTSKPVVVLNISASMERKMWSNDNWQKVVENCSELREYEIILSHAPEEKNRALELAGNCKLLKLYPSRNFFDVISLIKRSKLLLTPDTAMVHVAAAFDKPLVGLFSGLDDFYAKFHPLSSNYIDVHSPKGFDGVAGIKPESVIEAIKKILHNFPFDLEH